MHSLEFRHAHRALQQASCLDGSEPTAVLTSPTGNGAPCQGSGPPGTTQRALALVHLARLRRLGLPMLRSVQILLWRTTALLSLGLGIVGLALPIMPTVPFVLFAAWTASKGWPSLERWLLTHPTYGTHICNWREHRAVPRKAKVLASLMMLVSAVGLQFAPAPLWFRIAVPLTMLTIAIWMCSRPEVSGTDPTTLS